MAAALPVVGSLLGGAATAGKGLFGTAEQADRGTQQRSRLQLRPEDQAGIQAQQARVQQQAGGLTSLAEQLRQQSFQAGAPQLGAISAPRFGGQLDELSRGLVAQGQQQLAQGASAQRQALANQFRQQPGVARALAAQSANRATLQQNPLLFQAAASQRAREGEEGRLRLASEQASNQALLQQQGAGQLARAEQLGFGQAGAGAQSQLLQQLVGLGQLQGERVQQTSQQAQGRSGGLFGK